MSWELLKDIASGVAVITVIFSVGVLNTLKQTISAQKDYISALEKKVEALNAEREEQNKVQHEKDLLLEQAVNTLDTIRDIPLATIAETLKEIAGDQKAIIEANKPFERRRKLAT